MEKKERLLKILGAAMWLALIILVFVYSKKVTADDIAAYAPKSTVLAACVMLLLFGLKSITFVFYSGILFAASGIIFPIGTALLVNTLGLVVMVSLPYAVGRGLGKIALDYLMEKYPKLSFLNAFDSASDYKLTLILRLNSLINYDLGSIYSGAKGFRYSHYLLISVLVMAPAMIIFTILGRSITDPPPAALGALVAMLAVMTALSFVLMKKEYRPAGKT